MHDFLLVLGSVITVMGALPYLRDTAKQKTRPRLASWIIFAILNWIGSIAAFAAGEAFTGVYGAATAVVTTSIVVLGIKTGSREYAVFDVVCFIGALFGLLLWAIFNSPVVAIIAAISIDFVAGLPTLKHGWQKPFEETWQSFLATAIGSTLVILSLESNALAAVAYPIFIATICYMNAMVITSRRRKLA